MSDVIFARPRDEYQSYADLWRLIQVSGYPLVYMDEMDLQSDNCYIFSTPSTHWHDGLEDYHFENARARVIYYNIEWYLDVNYKGMQHVEVWSADKWHADTVGVRYVPMGSHVNLNLFPPARMPKRYDVITLWGDSNRRYSAYDYMMRCGISAIAKAWGDDRHTALLQARAMCIVHQSERFCVAPLRWALAAAYNLPIITETLADEGIFGKTYKLMTDLEHVGEFIALWMRKENQRILEDHGAALHQLLCVDRTFRAGVDSAL